MGKGFEIGPIRPPSEASSLLLRITRNCSWNRCKFCNLYRDEKFSTRPMEEIKADIDQVALLRNNIMEWTKTNNIRDLTRVNKILYEKIGHEPSEIVQRYRNVLHWLNRESDSVFLQDANTVALSFNKLLEILLYLKEKLPQVKRVTSYGRVDSLAKFSIAEWTQLREAGLNRIHSGYESGSDKVLELIDKGSTKAQAIAAGQKIKAAGIELSIYFMPGVGGRDLKEDNALETADVINKVNPDFVRIRTFSPKLGTELMDEIRSGKWVPCTEMEKLLEIKTVIENLHNVDGYLYSDHMFNLFEEIQGNMKTDKEKMLAVIESFEKLDRDSQRRYMIARRIGIVRFLDGMDYLKAEQTTMLDNHLKQLNTDERFEEFLSECLRNVL